MCACLDSRGVLITPESSVHTITRSGQNPYQASYLWRVQEGWFGQLYLVPRPYQGLPEIRLTSEASRFLVVTEEREAFSPENHPAIWDEFLRKGWGIHAGILPAKKDDIYADKPCLELGICNVHNNLRDHLSLFGVYKDNVINTGGLSEHEYAARVWKSCLNKVRVLSPF